MKTLLLKFSGPLQSWGTNSHFETRHTDFYPSKSATIGMIAASFGYRRNEDEKIRKLNDLDFAVRVDQQGLLARDYHIAQKYKDNGEFERTYVTNRYYLEDAVFVVAIGHSDNQWITEIEEALRYPYFQPFMGRRSLPPVADFILGTTEKGVIESLEEHPWQAKNTKSRNSIRHSVIYADADKLDSAERTMRKDRVLSFSQKNRKYGYRSEARCELIVEEKGQNTDHDAFGAIGG